MTHSANNHSNSFYNAILAGPGYINRVKLVKPEKGTPYYSVAICILAGKTDSPSKTYINTTVKGTDAIKLLEQYEERITAANTKLENRISVFGTFGIGDIAASSYTNRQGEFVPTITGRLVYINYLKIGDDVVHFNSTKESNSDASEQEVAQDVQEEPSKVANEVVESKPEQVNVQPAKAAPQFSTGGAYGAVNVTYG